MKRGGNLVRNVENPMVIDQLWAWKEKGITDDCAFDVFEDEGIVKCCICGYELEIEEAIDSELWEDTYLCDNRSCHDIHYQGWFESMEIQKYYIKRKSVHRVNEHFFKGIQNLSVGKFYHKTPLCDKAVSGRK